jgi:two-component system, sensor histidine kinase
MNKNLNMEKWKGKKILVAEDEMANFMLISALLKPTGIEITHAKNGKKVIEIFENEHFDIILMDIKMPLIDGFEATREIRKSNSDIVIIAQTAYAYKREDCIANGFSDYISKPFNRDALTEIIRKYFERKQSEDYLLKTVITNTSSSE